MSVPIPLSSPLRIAILGGGITGLSLHHFLRHHNITLPSPSPPSLTIDIYDSQSHVGGWINTHRPTPSSSLLELGPRSLAYRGKSSASLMKMMDNLDLISVTNKSEKVKFSEKIILSNGFAKKRFVMIPNNLNISANGTSHVHPLQIPTHIDMKLLRFPFISDMIKFGLRDVFAASPPHSLFQSEDISIHTAFTSILRSPRMVSYLIDPMVAGIYGGNINKLSFQSCFPSILNYINEGNGSLVRGMMRSGKSKGKHSHPPLHHSLPSVPHRLWIDKIKQNGIFTFQGGLSTLINHLENEIQSNKSEDKIFKMSTVKKIDIRNNHNIHNNHHHDQHPISVSYAQNDGTLRTSSYDYVISTLPSPTLSTLLPPSLSPSLTSLLSSVHYTNITLVCISIPKSSFPPSLQSFGILFSSEAQRILNNPILGVSFDSMIFNSIEIEGEKKLMGKEKGEGEEDQVRMTWMLGGDRRDVIHESDEQMIKWVDEGLQSLHIPLPSSSPYFIHRNVSCIPQYYVGHKKKVDEIHREISKINEYNFGGQNRFHAIGNSFNGVSINDLVHVGYETAEKIIAEIHENKRKGK